MLYESYINNCKDNVQYTTTFLLGYFLMALCSIGTRMLHNIPPSKETEKCRENLMVLVSRPIAYIRACSVMS